LTAVPVILLTCLVPVAFPTIILIAPDRTIIEQDIWPFSPNVADGIMSGLGIEKQECLMTNTNELAGVIEAVQVMPSPFQDQLRVQFNLPQSAQVQLELLNSLGQVLRTQGLNQLGMGEQQSQFETSNLSDGVYFVRITIDGQSSISQKVVKASR
jgi:hypothetical protein